MKIQGIVTQVQERKSVNKTTGAPVTYRDIFIADANPDPLTRFSSEIVVRPTEDENNEWKFKAGNKLDLSIRQVLEVRNGLPVCRAVYSQPTK